MKTDMTVVSFTAIDPQPHSDELRTFTVSSNNPQDRIAGQDVPSAILINHNSPAVVAMAIFAVIGAKLTRPTRFALVMHVFHDHPRPGQVWDSIVRVTPRLTADGVYAMIVEHADTLAADLPELRG